MHAQRKLQKNRDEKSPRHRVPARSSRSSAERPIHAAKRALPPQAEIFEEKTFTFFDFLIKIII
jgi:hypothetical protein